MITGRGVVSPLGVGLDAHWDALAAGRFALAPCERLAALASPAPPATAVADDAIRPHLGRLPRKQQKLYNRPTLLAMLAASMAMEDAGLTAGAGDPSRFGVVLGVNACGWELDAMTRYLAACESPEAPGTLDLARANRFCMKNINPLDFSLKTLPNLAAGHVAIAWGAEGMCRALADGMIAGTHAIGQAFRTIADGDLDVALCGGTDAQLEEFLFAVYWAAGIVASDAAGTGVVPGEGSGVLVVEEAGRARARGARVRGELLAFAAAAGDGAVGPERDREQLAARIASVVGAAIDEADVVPDLVALHGEGMPAHDAAEAAALARVLPRGAAPARVALKRAHGHLGAAAGPVELLACSAAFEHAMIPATALTVPEGAQPRHALVISIGLFGECAAIVLGRGETPAGGEATA
jgi:3-oxoacyl-[acyl-carrier-protein] synthase II